MLVEQFRKIQEGVIISTRNEDSVLLSRYGNEGVLKIAQLHHDHCFDKKLLRDFARNYENIDYFTLLTPQLQQEVAEIMNTHAGIIRSEEVLTEGLQKIAALGDIIKQKQAERGGESNREYYLEASRRLLCVARLIMSPALLRKESRGGHYREDYPCADENYALHSVQRRGEEITTASVNSNYFNF